MPKGLYERLGRGLGYGFVLKAEYLFLFVRVGAARQEGRPCLGRKTADRHGNTSKSILFALVRLCVYIRSYFSIDDLNLFTT